MCLLKNSIFTLPLPKNRFAVGLNMFWFHVELSFCPKVFSNGLTLQVLGKMCLAKSFPGWS